MRRTLLIPLLFMAVLTAAQPRPSANDVRNKLKNFYDQFNNKLNEDLSKNLVIVFIPGSNDPFAKIYDKHKDKKLAEHVQFVGGFKEIMTNMDPEQKKKHLQEAFVQRYGKDHFTILLDLNSELANMLKFDGYTIIKVNGKSVDVKSYDFDRIEFFKDLNSYFIQ